MRILHIQDYFHPQLGYQETFIMRVQIAAGHNVHILTSNRNVYAASLNTDKNSVFGSKKVASGVEIVEGIRVHHLPCRFGFLQKFYRLWLVGLENKIAEIEPDLIIVHGMQSITSYRVAKSAFKRGKSYKLIFDSHAARWNSARKFHNLYYGYYRLFQSEVYMEAADGIIAIDTWSRDFLISECGIKPERIEIIPLGAEHRNFYHKPEARITLRRKWGFNEQQTVFIYIGKMMKTKGVHFLVEAAFKLSEKGFNIGLLIVGSGDEDYIRKIKDFLEAQSRIKYILLPHIPNPELPEVYSAADVSVWPLEVSIGTLEAQSCGLPLIVGDEPVLVDRIKYGNGIAYKKGDVSDLAEKMGYLVEHPEIRREMGLKGRRAIEEELNWEVITRKFMETVGLEL